MSLTVRLLTTAEAPQYVALRRLMLVDAPWAFGSSPENDRAGDPARVAAAMTRPDYAIAGGFVDDALKSVAVVLRDDAPKRCHVASLVSVFTHPDARGRGLARRVVQLAIATAARWEGVAKVQLAVSSNAPVAKALYETLGFVAWGHEPDCLRVDGASYDETHMELVRR
jgi:GNAT superfamily N-acetyltransferase